MPIESKRKPAVRKPRPVVAAPSPDARVQNLLGDFSEQTGALFG